MMLGFGLPGKSPESFLVPCFWLVSCAFVFTSPKTFKMPRLSNGTFLCALDPPSVLIPLQQQPASSSTGSPCVPATVECAQQCRWDARCRSFNVREDLNTCDLFYNLSTTCGIIPGCVHGQLNGSNCNFAGCPEGFVYSPNVSRCYRLLNETLNQTDAELRCVSLDPAAHLVMIANATQQSAVKAYLDSVLNPPATSACLNKNTVWTAGVKDPSDIRTTLFLSNFMYVWDSGTGVYYPIDYEHYSYGEPNGGNQGPYCVALWQGDNSQWNDEICSQQHCALCEYTP